MILAAPTMDRDQTTVYKQQIPAVEGQRWTRLDPRGQVQVESEQDLHRRPETVKWAQTTVSHDETKSGLRVSGSWKGQRAYPIPTGRDIGRYGATPHLEPAAIRVLRATYLEPVVRSLEKMRPHARTPGVAPYARELLDASAAYADRVPDDPLVEVILAFYPALADENHWADWSEDQLRSFQSVLQGLATKPFVSAEMVEKAILKIEEEVGVDTLPFEVDPREII